MIFITFCHIVSMKILVLEKYVNFSFIFNRELLVCDHRDFEAKREILGENFLNKFFVKFRELQLSLHENFSELLNLALYYNLFRIGTTIRWITVMHEFPIFENGVRVMIKMSDKLVI